MTTLMIVHFASGIFFCLAGLLALLFGWWGEGIAVEYPKISEKLLDMSIHSRTFCFVFFCAHIATTIGVLVT